ncbi:potassium channel family protein [Nocardioides mesophilus]|uniref:NAD-binding protein n=1 Tax=Nocardioides mesophilus TaxID=433659 RepID=A0A7G9R9R9_9ACTN|nr:potassium channel protein [Nocardioides mesophilus]QNN52344.1 NAD-binding protein [Nocardioides mesophilus]
MANPLLAFVVRVFSDRQDEPSAAAGKQTEAVSLPDLDGPQSSAGIFLVLRRMRAPLIVLIVVFAVSVLGLTLVPGEDPQGRPHHMSMFDAFYFMSYTATTIGFGELPHAFTAAQRMWVTFSIFLSVIGWAYAVGSLLALMQDRAFRRTLARRRFVRQVRHLREPFLVLVGYGNATKRLARSLDAMGRRLVIVESDESRVARVDLDSYRADIPALLGDARDTGNLAMAGIGSGYCEGVVTLTPDDDTNLDVTMTTALLRPDLPVIARANSRDAAQRMATFGEPQVVNPFDRFGDHLRILHRSPSEYQLMMWLTSTPGTPLPRRHAPLPRGRWVVFGYGRFGQELASDLRAEGLQVAVIEERQTIEQDMRAIEAAVVGSVELAPAVAFVAATESDTTNLWLIEAARRSNPEIFTVALQNRAANAPLFEAVGLDFGMQPAEVLAHEVLARLANPLLISFLRQVPRQGEEWAADLLARLGDRCGAGTPDIWQVRLDAEEAPALSSWLADGDLRLGDLLSSPDGRETLLDAVPIALVRDGDTVVGPTDDQVLRGGDELLLAGHSAARRSLDITLSHEPTAAYVIEGRFVPSGWLWRRLSRHDDDRHVPLNG